MSELSAPLSRRRARQARAAVPPPPSLGVHFPFARLAFGLLLLIAAGVGLRLVLVDDPKGGRPSTTVELNASHATNPVAGSNSAEPMPAVITADPDLVPAAPAGEAATLEAAVPDPTAIPADLVEETKFGQIPRISTTGVTPFDTFSRPADTAATAGGTPLVAIIVSGLGINLNTTLDAIQQLPDDVTLAFAPYGKALDRSVGAARTEGHEVFLEVPLEPFDYPDNDPGPDTLLTGQAPRDNLSKLFHVMSRFGGYAGVINNMGARFTASGSDFGPVMEEFGARGLGYLDDGSSNRSLAPQLARINRVPFRRVDAVLDANPARGAILEQLAALEQKARSTGSAVGIISALPVSIETITEWARGLEEKGIVIVPASALMKDDNA